MTERAQEFFSLAEIEAARPKLDWGGSLPLVEFGGLVAKYALKREEWQKCRLLQNASLCKHIHGRGWIARRKDDGREILIGKDCAHDHFGADSNFSAEQKRIDDELAIDALLRRFSEYANDPAYASRLSAAQQKQASLKGRIERERSLWPPLLLLRLADMAKTGRRRIGIMVHYIEMDEEGKQTRTNVAASIGDIAAPGALDLARVLSIGRDLSAAARSVRDAAPTQSTPRKELRKRVTSLEQLNKLEAMLGDVAADIERFNKKENLLLLPWAVRNDKQFSVATTALRLSLGRKVSDADVTKWIRDREDVIRTEHGGRNFHVDA